VKDAAPLFMRVLCDKWPLAIRVTSEVSIYGDYLIFTSKNVRFFALSSFADRFLTQQTPKSGVIPSLQNSYVLLIASCDSCVFDTH